MKRDEKRREKKEHAHNAQTQTLKATNVQRITTPQAETAAMRSVEQTKRELVLLCCFAALLCTIITGAKALNERWRRSSNVCRLPLATVHLIVVHGVSSSDSGVVGSTITGLTASTTPTPTPATTTTTAIAGAWNRCIGTVGKLTVFATITHALQIEVARRRLLFSVGGMQESAILAFVTAILQKKPAVASRLPFGIAAAPITTTATTAATTAATSRWSRSRWVCCLGLWMYGQLHGGLWLCCSCGGILCRR